jgi:uncharacterized membrane protein
VSHVSKWLVWIYFGLVSIVSIVVLSLYWVWTGTVMALATWDIGVGLVSTVAFAFSPLLIVAVVLDRQAKRALRNGDITDRAI